MEGFQENYGSDQRPVDGSRQDNFEEENLEGISIAILHFQLIIINLFFYEGKIFIGGLSWQTTADG